MEVSAMSDYNAPMEKNSPEKKWFTYGGKVDEHLMNMLREAQQTAGIKKFSDFMNDMLKIYKDNKQNAEPPQMQVIRNAVTDIIKTTESLLDAMQIIETDKFKAIAEYQQRAEDAQTNALQVSGRISELEKELADMKKVLAAAQAETKSTRAELTSEFERRNNIEGMISRVQQLADDALSQKQQAEEARDTALETVNQIRNKAALLEAANQDIQSRLDSALAAIDHDRSELINERNSNKALKESLSHETIVRNRLEERLHMLEPQYEMNNKRLAEMQTEINNSRLSERALTEKALHLEAELRIATVKLNELKQTDK
jgi:chromosome segregation ATPase